MDYEFSIRTHPDGVDIIVDYRKIDTTVFTEWTIQHIDADKCNELGWNLDDISLEAVKKAGYQNFAHFNVKSDRFTVEVTQKTSEGECG